MTYLQTVCAAVMIRRNVGSDFGAMREGLARLRGPLATVEQLLILNDSVYGPLQPLDEMLAQIDFGVADIWGATESWQRRYHLQSFFLGVSPAVLPHPPERSFAAAHRKAAARSR